MDRKDARVGELLAMLERLQQQATALVHEVGAVPELEVAVTRLLAVVQKRQSDARTPLDFLHTYRGMFIRTDENYICQTIYGIKEQANDVTAALIKQMSGQDPASPLDAEQLLALNTLLDQMGTKELAPILPYPSTTWLPPYPELAPTPTDLAIIYHAMFLSGDDSASSDFAIFEQAANLGRWDDVANLFTQLYARETGSPKEFSICAKQQEAFKKLTDDRYRSLSAFAIPGLPGGVGVY
jgi:hypothetical protein